MFRSMRGTNLCVRALLATSTIFYSISVTSAIAQSVPAILPPVRTTMDENNVDLSTGRFRLSFAQLAIGDPASYGLTYARWFNPATSVPSTGSPPRGFRDAVSGYVIDTSGGATVVIGKASESFKKVGTVYTPSEGTGSTLVFSGNFYTYTLNNGTIIVFTKEFFNSSSIGTFYGASGIEASPQAVLSRVTNPDGTFFSIVYEMRRYSVGSVPSVGQLYFDAIRPRTVQNNIGYSLNFTYEDDGIVPNLDKWFWTKSISAFNGATVAGPMVTFSNYAAAPFTSTDALGRTTTLTSTTVKRPSSAADNFIATVNASNQVTQVNADGIITNYSYADAAGVRTVTVSKASLPARVYTFNIASGLLLSERNEVGQTTTYTY
jgi:hypothetical protein